MKPLPLGRGSSPKYIAYIDINKRQVVYMDANFRGNVHSANTNGQMLKETMPAFVEYLDSIPSVYDVFKKVRKSKNGLPVSYDDKNLSMSDGQSAYIFKPVNENNKFEQIDINKLLY